MQNITNEHYLHKNILLTVYIFTESQRHPYEIVITINYSKGSRFKEEIIYKLRIRTKKILDNKNLNIFEILIL